MVNGRWLIEFSFLIISSLLLKVVWDLNLILRNLSTLSKLHKLVCHISSIISLKSTILPSYHLISHNLTSHNLPFLTINLFSQSTISQLTIYQLILHKNLGVGKWGGWWLFFTTHWSLIWRSRWWWKWWERIMVSES